MPVRVTGIDACRGGWVAVTLSGARATRVVTGPSLPTVVPGACVVGIDMPLGFHPSGWRACDSLARRLLGPRRSSVFAIPPLAVWSCESYAAANRRCRELTGQGMSAQAWGLRKKLLEANALRASLGLFEVHPELSFTAMAGAPLPLSKHTPDGHALRLSLLEAAGIHLPSGERSVDVLDAAAVAWSASRIALGLASVVPDPPETGTDGRDLTIRW
jgi:predicted RNase H-like nuclease